MTIGDFVMYILFTGLMAAPVVQIASIGTQISEAFAGPRPHPRAARRWRPRTTRTHARRRCGDDRGEIAFERRDASSTTPACRC